MGIIARGGTDIGRKRVINEDRHGIFDDLGLFVVADGMGGHAAGEVASTLAVDTLKSFIAATAGPEEITWPYEMDRDLPYSANRLLAGIKLANRIIYKRAMESAGQKGMGTTIVSALAEGNLMFVAHVGDSRAYLFSNGALRRISTDHSYVEEMVMGGHITADQARSHPLRNIVTRALGTKPDVTVDISRHELVPGDVYLLCSDGLSGMIPDKDIGKIISENPTNPAKCIEDLISRANANGGDDNITAILLQVV